MKKVILGALCLLLLLTFAGCSSQELPLVTVTPVKSGMLDTTAYRSAIEAKETVKITPAISGKVTNLYAEAGKSIQAGDVLFTLDRETIALQVKQAEAGLNAANVAYGNAKASFDSESAVIPAQVACDEAQKRYDQTLALFQQGFESQSQVDAAKAALDTAQAQLQTALRNLRSSVDSAAAQVQSAQAALDLARKSFDNCSVTAPISGEVLSCDLHVGDMVSPQSSPLTLFSPGELLVKIQVSETMISRVSLDMPGEITLSATGAVIPARVSRIAAAVDTATGMVEVELALPTDSIEGVFVGMMTDVRLLDRESRGLIIPEKAVIQEEGGSYVYLFADGQVEKRLIATGDQRNGNVEVTSGLAAGELVVLQSSTPLSEGLLVESIPVE